MSVDEHENKFQSINYTLITQTRKPQSRPLKLRIPLKSWGNFMRVSPLASGISVNAPYQSKHMNAGFQLFCMAE